MTTDEEIKELKKRVTVLEHTLKLLAADVASRATVGGVLQLDARVGVLEKKLDKLSPPPNVARLL